ncbi:DUF2946 domain-containing protein [Chitinimonas naiadis]
MTHSRPRYRLCLWIAALAILASAVMPALGQMRTTGKFDALVWAELCSSTGNKRVVVSGVLPTTPMDDGGLLHTKHCPYCLVPAATTALPPASPLILPLVLGGAVRPPQFYAAPRPLFAWAAAQPRGPPIVS